MKQLELLAPARDINIGIAAIDCGADAVYIAGPQFGARQAAGNSVDDIRKLCEYAHRFGARIFITLNTILYESELEDAYRFMLQVQDAGADAIIVQDLAVIEMARKGIGSLFKDLRIPLHASTQCAIRTPEQARFLEGLGFSRLILERELSLAQIRDIRKAVSCELEFFVHGALCVCYSGQCYLSEMIAGRSANRGECIQACRSRYDLVDEKGRVIVKDKALLSLKDYNLRNRLDELAEAGICSFKIEGRLKNISYVRNIVRDYSLALDSFISRKPASYERASFGSISGGFDPDAAKTFNRGYTELFLDGRRGKWAAMDAAKSMGEEIGIVTGISRARTSINVRLNKGVTLGNGDGFSFISDSGKVEGFRGDICSGSTITCKAVSKLNVGTRLFRNINQAFEKDLERQSCHRELGVTVDIDILRAEEWILDITARSEDGRLVRAEFKAGSQCADNGERMLGMIRSQIAKSSGHYMFSIGTLNITDRLPIMSASFLNSIRRELAQQLDSLPAGKKEILTRTVLKPSDNHVPESEITYRQNISNSISESLYKLCGASSVEHAYEIAHPAEAELMRTKYCIRYELGICPVHHGAKDSSKLYLLNNGQRLALGFDCRRCEMTVTQSPEFRQSGT